MSALAIPGGVSGGADAAGSLLDFDFVDALHGWVLLDAGTELIVRRTFDGGRLWRPVPRQFGLGRPARNRGRSADRVRYADPRNGWVYRPGLFSTHDGGRNWARDEVAGDVVSLSPCGERVWAVVATATAQSLRVSSISTSAWNVPAQPAPSSPAFVVCDGAGRLWVASDRREAAAAGGESPLASTVDGGLTWASRPQPCEEGRFPGWLAASSKGGPLWLGCSGPDGAALALFRSDDAGATWRAAGNGGARLPVSSLAAGEGTVWITKEAGPPRFSRDGGKTWSWSPEEGAAPGATGSYGRVLFIDALHGWVGFSGVLDPGRARTAWLFRTSDGGRRWEAHSVAGR